MRRPKEVALGRYSAFVIRGTDGSLDYNTGDGVVDPEEDGEKKPFFGRGFSSVRIQMNRCGEAKDDLHECGARSVWGCEWKESGCGVD